MISRVTGGEPSQIDGRLRSTIPGADVWLFNPNGVGFGKGAELDVRGSFHAGTADYVGFQSGERFDAARSPESVLATAPPAAFGFLPESHAASLAVEGSTLEVPDGETLELVAGDLSLTGAELAAPGGHVDLQAQGEVVLSASLVEVGRQGDTPGTISIRGGQILIQGDSQVLAENESPVPAGSNEPGPGSISVEGSESVLVDASLLSVSTQGAANAGTIQVAGPVVTFQNGPGYDPEKPPPATEVGASAETTGSGAGGEIQIHAGELLMLTNGVGVSATAVGSAASGKAGSVEIVAPEVVVEQGSRVSAETAGTGAGGSISIAAGESVLVDGGLLSVNTWSAGDAGTIRIAGFDGRPSREVTFQNGIGYDAPVWTPTVADVGARAETTSSGAAGEIRINATKLLLQKGVAVSAVAVGTKGGVERGKSGTVEIRAHSVEVLERSAIATGGWWSLAEPGSIRIDLGDDGSLLVDGGAQVPDPAAYALIHSGNGTTPGTIEIEGGTVEVRDGGSITIQCFDACTSKQATRRDDQATLRIQADELILSGGEITAPTNTSGDAGTITIDADSITIGAGGVVDAGTNGVGNAGEIVIDAGSLELRAGGQITARGLTGNGGSVVVDADTVQIGPGRETGKEGAGIFVTARGTGNAGSVEITASKSITLDDFGGDRFDLTPLVSLPLRPLLLTGIVSGTARGAGGSITLDAPEITVSNGAFVTSGSVGGKGGGGIVLRGDRIRIESGGIVTGTSLLTPAEGGAVTLDASQSIEVVGRSAFGDPSQVSSSTLNQGPAGSVTLTAPRIVVDGGAVSTVAVPLNVGLEGGAAGEIKLDAGIGGGQVIVRDGGQVTASTVGSGDGGSIEIRAGESIRVEGTASSIASRTGATGTGGNVVMSAPRIEVASGGKVSAESRDGLDDLGPIVDSFRAHLKDPPPTATGDAGSIALAASHLVHLDDGDITTASPRGQASGGNITIDPVFVILENGSRAVATADEGHGGRIQITTDNFFQFPGSVVSAASGNQALSGTVEVHSPDVDLAGTLTPLPSAFLDAASLMRERCAARRSGERAGSFSVRGPGGIPAEPDGWLRAPVVLADTSATAAGAPAQPALVASLLGPFLAHGACP